MKKSNDKPANKPKKKYKTTVEEQDLIVDQFRPYDQWASGTCPVCGYGYSGDAFCSIRCKRCGQLLSVH